MVILYLDGVDHLAGVCMSKWCLRNCTVTSPVYYLHQCSLTSSNDKEEILDLSKLADDYK